jgi:hypothetical protein
MRSYSFIVLVLLNTNPATAILGERRHHYCGIGVFQRKTTSEIVTISRE